MSRAPPWSLGIYMVVFVLLKNCTCFIFRPLSGTKYLYKKKLCITLQDKYPGYLSCKVAQSFAKNAAKKRRTLQRTVLPKEGRTVIAEDRPDPKGRFEEKFGRPPHSHAFFVSDQHHEDVFPSTCPENQIIESRGAQD